MSKVLRAIVDSTEIFFLKFYNIAMKIKSSFKDYYDSVGFDAQDNFYQSVTYVRIPALCYKYELIKNPCLREFDFARIMPSTTIYQEIEMFLGNVLVKDSMPPSYQSDIEKVVSHGFDPKISFRKRKNTE